MATKARIVKLKGNHAEVIEVFYEGYLDYTGNLLKRNYKTVNQVNALMALGNINLLAETIEEIEQATHKISSQNICSVGNLSDLQAGTEAEYIYVYKVDEKKWYVFTQETYALLPLS